MVDFKKNLEKKLYFSPFINLLFVLSDILIYHIKQRG